jgi:hypothetical protein
MVRAECRRQTLVHFVRQNDELVARRKVVEGALLVRADHPACGIRRTVDDEQARTAKIAGAVLLIYLYRTPKPGSDVVFHA